MPIKELRGKGLRVVELMPELKDRSIRSIFDDQEDIGSLIIGASSEDEADYPELGRRYPSFEFPGKLAIFSGGIYEALGMRTRAVDIYKIALDILLTGLNYPANIGYGRLGKQINQVNYAIHFGIEPPIVDSEDKGITLLSVASDADLDNIRSLTNYLYQTLTRILYEKVKARTATSPFKFLSEVSLEYNGLIHIGDYGSYDEYGLDPEVKKRAYDLAREKRGSLEHLQQKAEVERIVLQALVQSLESRKTE